MDPALGRLVLDGGCRQLGPGGGQYYNPQSGFRRCTPDNAAFAKLISQYGFAIAPSAMRSARTTGYGGFELAIEADYTKIDAGAEYWKLGTQGPQDPNSKNFSTRNDNPDDFLQTYLVKVRKGFPFGLEVQSAIGFLAKTNITLIGADVRWSLLEGLRTGFTGILPDVSVGGTVRTVTGTPEFQLTVAGFDAQLSKGFPIAGTVVLTPYVGYQWIRIFGDSGLIDLTPNTDAVNYCGYQGTNTPVSPDPSVSKKGVYDGQPVCNANTGGNSADFNNTVVFDPVRLTRHRLHFGTQLRFQYVRFGVHFITDLVGVEDANKGSDYEIKTRDAAGNVTGTQNKFAGVSKQWTLAFDVGAIF